MNVSKQMGVVYTGLIVNYKKSDIQYALSEVH